MLSQQEQYKKDNNNNNKLYGKKQFPISDNKGYLYKQLYIIMYKDRIFDVYL